MAPYTRAYIRGHKGALYMGAFPLVAQNNRPQKRGLKNRLRLEAHLQGPKNAGAL